jgi:AI-2 transport protein TqsA
MLAKQTNLFTVFLSLGVLVIAVYLITAGQSILMPLAIAIFIWYLINAFAGAIQRLTILGWHPPRLLSFIAAFIVLFLCLSFIVELIANNLALISAKFPFYQDRFDAIQSKFLGHFHIKKVPSVFSTDNIMHYGAGMISIVGSELTSTAGTAIAVILYIAFLLAEQGSFHKKLSALISDPQQQEATRKTLDRVATNIRSFLWLQTLAGILAGIVSYIILKTVGVEFASFWAVMIFFLNYIPYIGAIIGTVFPTILTLIQFGSFIPFIIVGGSMAAVHFFIGSILEPWMYGRSLKLSPIIILVTIAFWGSTWGIIGMILSVPITVIIMIICEAFPKTRPIAIVLSKDGDIETFDD